MVINLHHAAACRIIKKGASLPILSCNYTKNSQFVNEFVYEIAREEMNLEKQAKIDGLKLTDDEWKWVKVFLDLLSVWHSSHSSSSVTLY